MNQRSELAVSCADVTRTFVRKTRGTGLRAALRAFARPVSVEKIAVNKVSFTIERGSCVGLIGANGAGKTTLLKMMAGLLHPTAGQVEVLGFDPAERKEEFLKSIGMVMGQKSALWVDIPAQETFDLLASIYEIDEGTFNARVKEMAELFEVQSLLGVQVRKLSLGERMKMEIMASLLHAPKLLFLDEPTIGLDVVARRKIRQFIRSYNKAHGTTVLLTSHDMTDISEICDRLIIIDQGSVLFDGSLQSFERAQAGLARAKSVGFAFDLDGGLAAARAQAIAHELRGQVLKIEAGSALFSVPSELVSRLIQRVLETSVPLDIKIEAQNLETLIHEIMVKDKSAPL